MDFLKYLENNEIEKIEKKVKYCNIVYPKYSLQCLYHPNPIKFAKNEFRDTSRLFSNKSLFF